MRQFRKIQAAAVAFVVVVGLVVLVTSSGRADNDNSGAQDEKQMIQIGLKVAPFPLNVGHKDADMVGLGSYLVNVGGCNGCHTADPSTEYVPTGNPYLLRPPQGPYGGVKQVNLKTYLGGGSDFGEFPSNGHVHIISRNLTPDKTGLPEGGDTLSQFIQIMRTGVDLDHAHPTCDSTHTTNCLLPPFNGDLLQVMPWPDFQNITDRQLVAIYAYLSTVPCLEGGPGEPANRCK